MTRCARLRQQFFDNQIFAVVTAAMAFGLLAWAGITLTRDEGRIAIVWLPNALLVAILLRSDFKQGIAFLPPAFLANIGANMLVGDALLRAATLASVNQLEILVIWLLMRRIGLARPNTQNPNDLMKFAFIGGLIGPMISGVFAALYLSNGVWNDFTGIWVKWATTDGLGMLLLAPAILAIGDMMRNRRQKPTATSSFQFSKKTAEWILIQGLVLAAAITLFAIMSFPVFFLVAPLILLSTFRLGAWGTAVSTIAISIVVAVSVSQQLGPFNSLDISLSAKLVIMQMFLLSCFAVGFPVAAILAKKEVIRKELRTHRDLSNSMLHAAEYERRYFPDK